MASHKWPPGPGFLFDTTGAGAPVYRDSPVVTERKLQLVEPLKTEDEVSVERAERRVLPHGHFWIQIVRHSGGTRCAVMVSRAQLEMLLEKIPAALEEEE